jgi:hypothetical protein
VKSGRTWVGIGAAFLANVVAIGLGLGIAAVSPSSTRGTVGFYAVAGLQLLALVGCIVAGVIFYTRRDRDFGTGLLIGGGLAMLIMPCVGFGVCVVAIGGNL